jgi:hypothetical protein
MVPRSYHRLTWHSRISVRTLAIQPSHLVHRNNVPGHRAGDDRVAGSLMDREVTYDPESRQSFF